MCHVWCVWWPLVTLSEPSVGSGIGAVREERLCFMFVCRKSWLNEEFVAGWFLFVFLSLCPRRDVLVLPVTCWRSRQELPAATWSLWVNWRHHSLMPLSFLGDLVPPRTCKSSHCYFMSCRELQLGLLCLWNNKPSECRAVIMFRTLKIIHIFCYFAGPSWNFLSKGTSEVIIVTTVSWD